jgi:hypothetical protein
MALPLIQSKLADVVQLATKWKAQLDPVLANPTTNLVIIKNVALINGASTINHVLQRMQQGWILMDVNGAATIYRSADFNSLTLQLTSNAAVTVSIGVF